MTRETAHVHLVDNGLCRWALQRCITLPVVCARIDHNALHRGCSIVPGFTRRLAVVVCGDDHTSAIGVEKHFVAIKAQTNCGIHWSVNPVGIDLARLYVVHKDVPVMISTVCGRIDVDNARRTGLVFAVEQHKFDARRLAGEQAEAHAGAAHRGAQRSTRSDARGTNIELLLGYRIGRAGPRCLRRTLI